MTPSDAARETTPEANREATREATAEANTRPTPAAPRGPAPEPAPEPADAPRARDERRDAAAGRRSRPAARPADRPRAASRPQRTRAARGADRLVLPSDADVDEPAVVEAAREVRDDVALDLTLAMGARPAWFSAATYAAVDGLMDAQAICAVDAAPFDPHTLLMRHATGWRDIAEDGLEAQVQRFAAAYAEPLDEAGAAEALRDRRLSTRNDARPSEARPRPVRRDALRAQPLEDMARRVSGPAARLRPARGYHGRVQPSRFLRGPRDGAERLQHDVHRLADRLARRPLDPLIAGAIAYAWMLRLHPVRYGNRRLATLVADRLLRDEPGTAAARAGLGRALAGRREREAEAVQAATERGAWPAYLRWFLRTLARAVRASLDRRHRYHLAVGAFAARLDDADGRRLLGRRRVAPSELAAAAASAPYLAVRGITERGLAGRVTAARYLDALARLGLARPVRHGRYRLARIGSLVDALDPPPPPEAAGRGLDRLAATARTTHVCDGHDL